MGALTKTVARVLDEKPMLAVKRGRIARSGIQLYTRAEILARGFNPKQVKPIYREYRPASVLLANQDKFNYTWFANDHPVDDITPDNYKELASGMVGGNVDVDVVGELIYLVNDIVFFDKRAHDDYEKGKRELSSGYDSMVEEVENPDEVGYDFVLRDIPMVNHLALCKTARAGHDARILDSVDSSNAEIIEDGGNSMNARNGILRFLGIGKTKDSTNGSFSSIVFASLTKAKTMDAVALEKEKTAVINDNVACLGASVERDMLVGAVNDSYSNIDAVLEKKDEVAKVMDSLYSKCIDADKSEFEKAVEKKGDKPEKKGDKPEKKDDDDEKEKEGKTTDSLSADAISSMFAGQLEKAIPAAIEAAIPAIAAKVSDSVQASTEASVKKLLGITEKTKTNDNGQRVVDEGAVDYEIDGMFEGR